MTKLQQSHSQYIPTDLLPYNTFGISVIADRFDRFSSLLQLEEILQQFPDEIPLILGGGSNVLFTKESISQLVLKNEILGFEVLQQDDNHVLVRVGAGENWHQFVLRCLQLNFGGLENLSFIPGNVGASPMQNIGAYGVEIKDVFYSLEAYNIQKRKIETFYNADCKFGYRESVFKNTFKNQYIILNVCYRLTTKRHELRTEYRALREQLNAQGIVHPTIHDISQAVIAVRKSKLPSSDKIGNAGSFFKNPEISKETFQKIAENYENVPHFFQADFNVKIPAAWLIEQSGWKGRKIGNCGVHDKQALILVNYGNATGKEILKLSEEIIEDVYHRFGVQLQREVNIL